MKAFRIGILKGPFSLYHILRSLLTVDESFQRWKDGDLERTGSAHSVGSRLRVGSTGQPLSWITLPNRLKCFKCTSLRTAFLLDNITFCSMGCCISLPRRSSLQPHSWRTLPKRLISKLDSPTPG